MRLTVRERIIIYILHHFICSHCIPISFISTFCAMNHTVEHRTVITSVLRSRHYTDEVLLSESFVSVRVAWAQYNTLVHVIKPKNNFVVNKILSRISHRYQPDEDLRHKEIGRIITFICCPEAININAMRSGGKDSFFTTPMDGDVYVVRRRHAIEKVEIDLYELHSIGNIPSGTKVTSSQWATEEGMLNAEAFLRLGLRGDLCGFKMKVVGQEDQVYDSALRGSVSLRGEFSFTSGYNLYPLKDLQFMLNFTYAPIAGKGWMQQLADGNGTRLTGMGKQLLEKEADLIFSYNVLLSWRAEKVHFLPPLDYEKLSLFYRDFAASPSHLNMIKPFSLKLWLAFGASASGIFIAYVCFAYFTECDLAWRKNFKKGNATIVLFSLITCRGCEGEVSVTSLRIVLFAGLMTSYVVQCMYSASIMAFLFVPSTYIHYPDDLPKYGYHTIAAPEDRLFAMNTFTDQADQQRLLLDSTKYYASIEDSVSKILDSNQRFALICYGNYFYAGALKLNIGEKDLCSTSYVESRSAGRMTFAMAIRQGSPLRELLTQKTVKMVNSGLGYRYGRMHDRHSQVFCDEQMEKQFRTSKPVTLRQCTCAFGVFLLGIALALFSVLFEKWLVSTAALNSRFVLPLLYVFSR